MNNLIIDMQLSTARYDGFGWRLTQTETQYRTDTRLNRLPNALYELTRTTELSVLQTVCKARVSICE